MRKLLLASHGPLARAMRETLQLFCGEDPRVKVLCAYVDEDTMDVNELIDFWDRSRDPADPVSYTHLTLPTICSV